MFQIRLKKCFRTWGLTIKRGVLPEARVDDELEAQGGVMVQGAYRLGGPHAKRPEGGIRDTWDW